MCIKITMPKQGVVLMSLSNEKQENWKFRKQENLKGHLQVNFTEAVTAGLSDLIPCAAVGDLSILPRTQRYKVSKYSAWS